MGTCPQRGFPGAVPAAVVHTDDVVENGANVSDDVADNARLVEGGNDDPDVVVARVDALKVQGCQLLQSEWWLVVGGVL